MIELVKAKLSDIPDMQALVTAEVKEGIILNRTEDEVATNIRSYVLAKDNGKLVGYTALHIHSKRLAEIRSLIVDESYRGQNVGKRMVKFTLEEAKALGVEEDVLVLTYLPQFFEKLNFNEINKEVIPEHKIWADCIKPWSFSEDTDAKLSSPSATAVSWRHTAGATEASSRADRERSLTNLYRSTHLHTLPYLLHISIRKGYTPFGPIESLQDDGCPAPTVRLAVYHDGSSGGHTIF